jgi:tRNA threonylcarbamoyl adenosine modification protein YeaZ
MLILAADTSLALLSVALVRDDETIGTITLEGKSSRNEKLLPAIDWLLSESGVDRHDIELFATTRGPGSFTGVRIGLATLQGLAFALGRPICAMSTHEAIASAQGDDRVAIVDDAGRGELYISIFEGRREIAPPNLGTTGERDALAAAGTRLVTVSHFLAEANVALACARRAREIALANELVRYADVTPIYGRLAEADVKLQQKVNA